MMNIAEAVPVSDAEIATLTDHEDEKIAHLANVCMFWTSDTKQHKTARRELNKLLNRSSR